MLIERSEDYGEQIVVDVNGCGKLWIFNKLGFLSNKLIG